MISKNRHLALLSTLALGSLAASTALADPTFTAVQINGGELNHSQILHNMYGGTWNLSGNDYTAGGLSAVRVADAGVASPLDVGTGFSSGITDELWAGSTLTLTAKSKNAGDSSEFGWIDNTGPGGFQSLFNTGSIGASAVILGSSNFRWALKDLSVPKIFTSDDIDNIDIASAARDQLVTYRINGLATSDAVYALFWEDRINGFGSADYDYNDAVIELRSAPSQPTPGAAGVFGVCGLAGLRRRRK